MYVIYNTYFMIFVIEHFIYRTDPDRLQTNTDYKLKPMTTLEKWANKR